MFKNKKRQQRLERKYNRLLKDNMRLHEERGYQQGYQEGSRELSKIKKEYTDLMNKYIGLEKELKKCYDKTIIQQDLSKMTFKTIN